MCTTSHGSAKRKVSPGGIVGLDQRYASEIAGQRANFCGFIGSPYEVIAVLPVESAEGANNIADIGTDAKISAAPDIYGDLHAVI
jgi:hypothetical protein